MQTGASIVPPIPLGPDRELRFHEFRGKLVVREWRRVASGWRAANSGVWLALADVPSVAATLQRAAELLVQNLRPLRAVR